MLPNLAQERQWECGNPEGTKDPSQRTPPERLLFHRPGQGIGPSQRIAESGNPQKQIALGL